MTLPNQVYQYPHESWSDAFHRRQAENLTNMQAAIDKMDTLIQRDAQLGAGLVDAFDELGRSLTEAMERF